MSLKSSMFGHLREMEATILDWDGETVFVRGEFKDLCPMCMEKLMKWFESEDD